MGAAEIAKKMLNLGACKEGRDWIEQTNQGDFQRGWRACPAPEFMCWLLTRLVGKDGVRAAVACSKLVVEQSKDPLLLKMIALSEQVLAGKSTDTKALQEMAYDATETALKSSKAHGSAYLSASYAAYAVHFAFTSSNESDADKKLKALLKASQHSSDAVSHAKHGLPQKTNLVAVVRATFSDDVVYKAWLAAPG